MTLAGFTIIMHNYCEACSLHMASWSIAQAYPFLHIVQAANHFSLPACAIMVFHSMHPWCCCVWRLCHRSHAWWNSPGPLPPYCKQSTTGAWEWGHRIVLSSFRRAVRMWASRARAYKVCQL